MSNVYTFSVFPVDIIDISAYELAQEAYGGLCDVVTVRYDITDFSHMVQVFDEPDVIFIRDFRAKGGGA